jgi:hypothetical protein
MVSATAGTDGPPSLYKARRHPRVYFFSVAKPYFHVALNPFSLNPRRLKTIEALERFFDLACQPLVGICRREIASDEPGLSTLSKSRTHRQRAVHFTCKYETAQSLATSSNPMRHAVGRTHTHIPVTTSLEALKNPT